MQYFRENKSQRAISRDLKMSRSTVAKYINEFKSKLELLEDLDKDEEKDRSKMLLLIEEMTSKPKYDTSSRTRTKLTDKKMAYQLLIWYAMSINYDIFTDNNTIILLTVLHYQCL